MGDTPTAQQIVTHITGNWNTTVANVTIPLVRTFYDIRNATGWRTRDYIRVHDVAEDRERGKMGADHTVPWFFAPVTIRSYNVTSIQRYLDHLYTLFETYKMTAGIKENYVANAVPNFRGDKTPREYWYNLRVILRAGPTTIGAGQQGSSQVGGTWQGRPYVTHAADGTLTNEKVWTLSGDNTHNASCSFNKSVTFKGPVTFTDTVTFNQSVIGEVTFNDTTTFNAYVLINDTCKADRVEATRAKVTTATVTTLTVTHALATNATVTNATADHFTCNKSATFSSTVTFTGSTSGVSHADLSNATAGSHHTKYTDAEAQAVCVNNTAYAGTWNGVTDVAPSKNAVYDQMELRALDTEVERHAIPAPIVSWGDGALEAPGPAASNALAKFPAADDDCYVLISWVVPPDTPAGKTWYLRTTWIAATDDYHFHWNVSIYTDGDAYGGWNTESNTNCNGEAGDNVSCDADWERCEEVWTLSWTITAGDIVTIMLVKESVDTDDLYLISAELYWT